MLDSNPFVPPSDVAIVTSSTIKRPRGISILAFLAMTGGIGLFSVPVTYAISWEQARTAFQETGFHPVFALVSLVFLAVLALVGGIGMWRGMKMGWWLGCFYYVYAIFRNGATILNIALVSDSFVAEDQGADQFGAKYVIRVAINFLLVLYFFKGNVLGYFGLSEINKPLAIGILLSICTGITVAASVASAIFL
ncbi:hypothetical protein [Roseiconus lacunae]|uniref:Yip1 domain-containing protein n=1 Tax=Roseiconus lacunae TaxID=2605694 RepID=A0ABT7PH90_9BACT|nr:hypothetical protein [Roseiconus lacunae]MDM4015868.1 hypothetical protein [Roseiconus lacunae]